MRYACLIYFDPKTVFDRSPEAEAVLRAVGPHDVELKASSRMVLFAPVVSSTAVGNTSVVARRPRVARNSGGSSFQLTWRETNLERRVAASAA